MVERVWTIYGYETLGMQRIEEENHPWKDKVPITPTMSIHLDQVVIQTILIPIKTKLLKDLQAKIDASCEDRRDNWFDVFLATFLLSNNTERLLSHSRTFARKFADQGRYTTPLLAEGYFHAANTFLAHFHYVCQGCIPLYLDWHYCETKKLAALDSVQRDYLQDLRRKISEREKALLGLRSEQAYESDLFFGHQLFFRHSTPVIPRIQEKP